jgi:hypothetical protein
MEGGIRLSVLERKTVLSAYRGGGDARVARRAHVLLLLDLVRRFPISTLSGSVLPPVGCASA